MYKLPATILSLASVAVALAQQAQTTQPSASDIESMARVAQFVADTVSDPCFNKAREDVNCDGKVDLTDAIAVKAKIPQTTQPVTPPPVTPPPVDTTRAPATCAIDPSMGWAQWQTILDNANPGDIIDVHGGEYHWGGNDQLNNACLMIRRSGEAGKPITVRAALGEVPVFIGAYPLTWAIVIGNIGHDRDTSTGVHDIVVDGLRGTLAPWDGLQIEKSSNIVVRNCWLYSNNFNSPNGYKAGIKITPAGVSTNILIERCRVFDNGNGIVDQDSLASDGTAGLKNSIIRDNFVFGNSRTANAGNSSGIELSFPTHCTIEGNIVWDNPDCGINGQGHNFCRVIRNICVNSWQHLPGANNEGIKINVRGGGCNVIACNLSTDNGNCGIDAADGIGDVVLNNTLVNNYSWGALLEGRQMMMFNNIISGNSTKNGTDIPLYDQNSYPEMDALGFSLISDWNTIGRIPVVYTSPTIPIPFPNNSNIQPVSFNKAIFFPRADVRQIVQPETLFGSGVIENARAYMVDAYRPTTTLLPGDSIIDITGKCNANVPAVLAALDAKITEVKDSPDLQMKQGTVRWKQLKAELNHYDLNGIHDLNGNLLQDLPSTTSQPFRGAIK